jgi:ribose transport system substrate-binding protein
VVIVSAPVDLPPSPKLGYIVNDDEKMGAAAAEEVGRLIGGEGAVALVGLTRHAPGVALRVRSAEQLFATKFPEIRIVSRVSGAYDSSRAQELAEGAVYSNPDLKAILSFTATSTRGVYAGLKGRSLQQAIRLVGCEQDSDLLGYVETGEIAAILAEDTYRMGFEAVKLIATSWAGKSIATKSLVPPLLITRHNLHSNEARLLTRLSR